jgi:hypothetical protein
MFRAQISATHRTPASTKAPAKRQSITASTNVELLARKSANANIAALMIQVNL